ncbi:MAG: hypothetical protein ACUVQ8_02360 [Nitrososphaeria archaeon]
MLQFEEVNGSLLSPERLPCAMLAEGVRWNRMGLDILLNENRLNLLQDPTSSGRVDGR